VVYEKIISKDYVFDHSTVFEEPTVIDHICDLSNHPEWCPYGRTYNEHSNYGIVTNIFGVDLELH
jgi:hypothetical protein